MARCQNGKLCRFLALVGCVPEEHRKPAGQRCAYACRCPAGVAAPLGCVICLQLGDVAAFFTLCAVLSERARWGWYHYPRSVPHVSETLRGQGVERQTLPLLGLGRRRSQRTQRAFGTAMRLCVSLFRGVAAPLGCVIFFRFCRNCGFHALCSGPFRVCEVRGGITTLGALCVLLKYRTAACQSGSFAVSLCPPFTFAKDPAGHYQYPHRYRSPAAQSPADKPPALD